MDFTYTEEQILLRDTVERFVRDEFPFEKRQAIIDQTPGYSLNHWNTLAELGVLALPISEASDGLGGGGIETMLVMDQLGRSLLPAPYVSSILLGAGLIDRLASNSLHKEILDQTMTGDTKLAFAYVEAGAGYDMRNIKSHAQLNARENDAGYLINAQKAVVLNADTADYIIVMVRTSGEQNDEQGISLFIVSNDTNGLKMQSYPTQDGARASEITLANVQVGHDALLGDLGRAYETIIEVTDCATSALCAEAVGIMWSVYDLTLEYMKTRKQFGAYLGSFQALQHRMVDMYMMCEMAQSMALEAATSIEKQPYERRKSIAAAKSLIGRYARKVGQEGIQLHGGIGMTQEYSVGHYFKRLCMIDTMFGDVSWHNAQYAESFRT